MIIRKVSLGTAELVLRHNKLSVLYDDPIDKKRPSKGRSLKVARNVDSVAAAEIAQKARNLFFGTSNVSVRITNWHGLKNVRVDVRSR